LSTSNKDYDDDDDDDDDDDKISGAIRYDTILCIERVLDRKLTCSQFSSPHGTNRKNRKNERTKNKLSSMISPVRSGPVR